MKPPAKLMLVQIRIAELASMRKSGHMQAVRHLRELRTWIQSEKNVFQRLHGTAMKHNETLCPLTRVYKSWLHFEA